MEASSLFALVGFFVGIVLHTFLLSVVVRRKQRGNFEALLISLQAELADDNADDDVTPM